MEVLYLITARGGTKGLPGKNIKPLKGKPLIWYTIDFARQFTSDENICLSTDSDEIISCSKLIGLDVPFKRPKELAMDGSSSYEVILHALRYYEKKGRKFEAVVLLQPTSPFRKKMFLKEMFNLYNSEIDMVVTVKESHENPYYSLFEEDICGFLKKSKKGVYTRRQDIPKVYSFNGSIYLINVHSLNKKEISDFTKIKKYVVNDFFSLDIDTQLDWFLAENLIDTDFLKI